MKRIMYRNCLRRCMCISTRKYPNMYAHMKLIIIYESTAKLVALNSVALNPDAAKVLGRLDGSRTSQKFDHLYFR